MFSDYDACVDKRRKLTDEDKIGLQNEIDILKQVVDLSLHLVQLVSSLAGQHLRPEDLALAAYRTCLIKNIADSLIVDF